MASTLTGWWVERSRQLTRTLRVRGRQRVSAGVSLIVGLALLFGPASLARSRAGETPRLSSDAALVVATPALHSIAHRSTVDASFTRRWLAPLDLAHPAHPVAFHARVLDAADRVPSRNGAACSGVAARGYDATAPPGSLS